MTLVDAFRRYGPGEQEAGELLLREINSVARRVAPGHQDRDDMVQTVMWRLAVVGPRGIRNGDPENDEQVRGFLGKAIRRGVIDESGRPKPDPLPLGGVPVAPKRVKAPDEETERDFWCLFEEYAIKADAKAALETLKELLSVKRGQSTVKQLLENHGIGKDGWRQRELRARRLLFNWLESLEISDLLHEIDLERIKIVVGELFGRPGKRILVAEHIRSAESDDE